MELLITSVLTIILTAWTIHHMDINNPQINIIQKDKKTTVDVVKANKEAPLTEVTVDQE